MGLGLGNIVNLIGFGVGYGGMGGVFQVGQFGGELYGFIYKVVYLGSGGGNGNGKGGFGGGMFYW